MTFTKNVGRQDRSIRLAVAGVLILAGLMVAPTGLKIILTVLGLVVLATGMTGVCLAYIPLKINTVKDGEE